MADRNLDRERRSRETEDNDWDWDYYYEYRYIPSSPYRRNIYDRNYYGREREDERSSPDRDYGIDYDAGYESRPYGGLSYGRYSGVGPRGYRRSDDRIQDDVNDRLTWHGYVDATDIQVEVNDGIVTLKGIVENRRQKRMAEDAAESVSGVEDVNNQLKLRNQSWNRGERGMSQGQARPGMEVIDREGEPVGEVKEVRTSDFLVDRSLARDVYIPFSACQTTDGHIQLNIRAGEVDEQDWEMPALFGTEISDKKR